MEGRHPLRLRHSWDARCRLVRLVLSGLSPWAASTACDESRDGVSAASPLQATRLARGAREETVTVSQGRDRRACVAARSRTHPPQGDGLHDWAADQGRGQEGRSLRSAARVVTGADPTATRPDDGMRSLRGARRVG
jgi:hypothetical protein